MRKFIVPQFIDIEDKIIGVITTRQFLIIIVAGVLLFLAYRLSTFGLFIIQAIFIMLVFGSLAFLKINGSNFHIFVLNFISSMRKPGLRVWQKELLQEVPMKEDLRHDQDVFIPKQRYNLHSLSELALIVDTGGMYRGEEAANFSNAVVYGSGQDKKNK